MQCFRIPLRNTYVMVVCDQVTLRTRYCGFSVELKRLWLSFMSVSERYARMRNEEKKGPQDRPLGHTRNDTERLWRNAFYYNILHTVCEVVSNCCTSIHFQDYRWLNHSLEESSGRESLQQRSVSIALSWLLLPPEVSFNRHGQTLII